MRTPGAAIAVAVAVGALVAAATLTRAGVPQDRGRPDAAARGSRVELAVADRANAHVSLASREAFVVAVWAASAPGGGVTDVFAAVSSDGGGSFSSPVRVNAIEGDARANGEQPPRVALVPRANGAPAIVVVWTAKRDAGTVLMTGRSSDGGRTFGQSELVRGSDGAGNRGWHAVAALGGSVETVWLDHRDMAKRESPAGAHPGHDRGAASKTDGAAMAQLSGFYAATLDSGAPGRSIARGVCYCCKTALATRDDGTVFAAWRHVYPGNIRDIAFTSSRDRGRTFLEPVRVSSDNWILDGCPDDGPAMVAEQRGGVHVVWPTLVPEPEPHVRLMYAATRDARTFTPRMAVETLGSLKPSHPQLALAGHELVLAWDEVIGGKRKVAISRADLAGPQVRFGTPSVISEDDSGVYPSVAAVPGGALVAWTSGAPDASTIVARRITPGEGKR